MIYQPAEDSYLLEKQVKRFASSKTFLDMGAGTGIQSKAAIKSGASSVLAADINQESIKYLKKQNISTIKSNLFSNIKSNFDLIAFNPPYLPKDKREPPASQLATTGGKHGDEVILRFLKQAPLRLNKNGIILLVISSLTPKTRILQLLKKLKLKKQILSSKKLFMEKLDVWKIKKS